MNRLTSSSEKPSAASFLFAFLRRLPLQLVNDLVKIVFAALPASAFGLLPG